LEAETRRKSKRQSNILTLHLGETVTNFGDEIAKQIFAGHHQQGNR